MPSPLVINIHKQQKLMVSRKMKVGDLAELAGILDWSIDTLLGAFLELKQEQDPEGRWAPIGHDKMQQEFAICWIKLDQRPSQQILRKLRPLKFFYDPFKNAIFGPVGQREMALKIVMGCL